MRLESAEKKDLDAATDATTSSTLRRCNTVLGAQGDEEHETCSQKLVIRNNNALRKVWKVIVTILLLYTATVFPYVLAFLDIGMAPDDVERKHDAEVFKWLNHVMDWLFYFDLFISFFCSYTNKRGKEVTDLRKVSLHYLRTTFLINFVACLPPVLMEEMLKLLFCSEDDASGSANVNKGSRIGRLQRVSRIARVVRIGRLVKLAALLDSPVWREIRTLRGVRIVNFFGITLLTVHIAACGWFICAAMHTHQEETWVYRREVTNDGLISLIHMRPLAQWVHSMYFVLTVFTTVGFGDMSAMTTGEIVYVMVAMIVGAVLNSIVLSEVITLLTSVDLKAREVNEQIAIMKGFAAHTHLDDFQPELARRLVDCVGSDKVVHSGVERGRMKDILTASQLPRSMASEMSKCLFEGRLCRNLFVTVVLNGALKASPRFPLLVVLAGIVRYFDHKEIVFYGFDHTWNVFLVLQGTFAQVGRPGTSGGESKLPQLVVKATEMAVKATEMLPGCFTINFINTKCEKRFFNKVLDGPCELSTTLSPYQLLGVGNYFGDYELFVDPNGLRRACVRCESNGFSVKEAGCLLVLNKQDIAELMDFFPHCASIWHSAAIRREEYRKKKLKQLTRHVDYKVLAARTIQQYVRKRAHVREEALVASLSSLKAGAMCFADDVGMRQQRVRGKVGDMPWYAKELAQDVECLRRDVLLLNGRMDQNVAGVHAALQQLRALVHQARASPKAL